MNIRSNPDTTLPAVTTGPLPSSRKIFASPAAAPDVKVPLREIILSEGAGEPNLPVYDTSGPYTDPTVTIVLSPAPISLTTSACSNTLASIPRARSASAALNPPIPPPTIAMRSDPGIPPNPHC